MTWRNQESGREAFSEAVSGFGVVERKRDRPAKRFRKCIWEWDFLKKRRWNGIKNLKSFLGTGVTVADHLDSVSVPDWG